MPHEMNNPEARKKNADRCRAWRKANPHKQKEYKQRRLARHPEYEWARRLGWYLRNHQKWPEQRQHKIAREITTLAVRYGKLDKPTTCSVCGQIKAAYDITAHHEDYSKPMGVVWACRKCHCMLDRLREERLGIKRAHRIRGRILSDADHAEIRRLYNQVGVPQKQIAAAFGVTNSHVSRIASGKAGLPKRSRVTAKQIGEMVALKDQGLTYPQIARRYGLAKSTVGFIVRKARRAA